ncbi:hypothetical protein DFH08DRAFT_808602 [Mycena albidolilacea]|uniref:Uncharacterized protein n=1 Tax=Mycena albidolilacea TaxID=1033008 RepID=A0AAD7A1Q1_9AGAR|nr:hypothetical protein DFH08DRAFT_808602 [Mycena albidolilacea]
MPGLWPVFATARWPSPKAITRALLLIQWTLLTSARLPVKPRATALPVPDINNQECKGNDFAGMLLTEINAFVRNHEDALKGIPYEEADRMVAGSSIADLWFRDFVDEAGPQEDGAWR